ncbi:MAG: hypothetical protein EXS43_10435 [Opitutus sp.]|nr:hypothetical protein [Opitutus sp.]
MKTHRLYSSFLIAAGFTLALLVVARADESTSSIQFSDPTKPGTAKILLARGDLRVQGTDAAPVTVRSEAKSAPRTLRKDGLRVITASTSYALNEKDNVVTLDAGGLGWIGGSGDFRLTVPRSTSVIVQCSFGGGVTCTGLTGDIEIHSMSGKIRLDDVSGGVAVDTMNGEIQASIRELQDNKPLSFNSMNGEVVLRVPANGKANVRLRTQNGSVLTDFEESALVTKTETAPRSSRSKMAFSSNRVLPPRRPRPSAPPRTSPSKPDGRRRRRPARAPSWRAKKWKSPGKNRGRSRHGG